ncbi:Siderophore iron transporter mirB [Pleurostoma richardsiae]|uniref:Siderophore iron transporter mirB n=1 Tax=Pleurostoma richardsiae TaxID=41990 RepID=A0AA38VET9_9PEZI|nr:Siderophore iron transporter mirB [Pleurostoma richardsiae]
MSKDHESVMPPDADEGNFEKERDAVIHDMVNEPGSAQSREDAINKETQAGVQKVEAIATVWTMTALLTAYVLIWIVYFIMLIQQGAGAALNPYVTSAFQYHSLTPTVGILSSVIGGVCNLTVAKILDIFGRAQGYIMSLLISTVGLVMMAATTNVEMYAAAMVFWTVGNNALLYSVNILVADTTALRNRGLMTALTSSPNIITIWLGGPISEASSRVLVGAALILLPFNLYALQPLGWRSPLIICLLVFGIILIIVFALWERFFAPVTFIPFSLLLDRNMVGACVLGAVLFFSFYCWNSFFSSFLQVVNNLSVTKASYVVQIYGLGSSLFSIATGVAIRYTGRFKAITLYGAIPVYTLFMGLMIYFREPGMTVGYIIMCQIFVSFAAGTIIITPQIAAMSASSHQHIAAVVAIISMFSSIGGAIGLTVAGAIWQSIFPAKLAEYLPAEDQDNLLNIYAMLDVQLSYPVGTPARMAIQHAYADAQKMMLIAGTSIWAVGVVAVAFWRNTDVKNLKQVMGHVI